MVLIGTAGILLATSQAHYLCRDETVMLRADTTCGPPATLPFTSTTSCTLRAEGAETAGLPPAGRVRNHTPDGGLAQGFQLVGVTADGGNVMTCEAAAIDGGFNTVCTPSCGGELDAGPCESGCRGTLIEQ